MKHYPPPRLLLILCCILVQFQFSRHFILSKQWISISATTDYSYSAPDESVNDKRTQSKLDSRNGTSSAKFGACLMVKDDNDLLYEWLAYHYTVLPLGYVVIGSDINNTQDPEKVLRRWTQVGVDDLQYWILQSGQFIHRHGNHSEKFASTRKDMSPEEEQQFHHHALVHRQKGFITTCAELLQRHGVGWTLFIDTDEFVALNQLSDYDDQFEIGGSGHSHYSMKNESYELRRDILGTSRSKFVSEIIESLQRRVEMGPCYTFPRLLVGAIENGTCPDEYGVEAIQQFARKHLGDRYQHMSTLRFHRHAKKGDFSHSKFGKVMMDLSRIPAATIQEQVPRNIHRPFAEFCQNAAGAHFPDSFFFLMHYIGSWERYNARTDRRRNFEEWRQRALVDFDDSACSASVFDFVQRFFGRFGALSAKSLLGVNAVT